MRAFTALRRQFKSAYKPRPRHFKKNGAHVYQDEVEDALQDNGSSMVSSFSAASSAPQTPEMVQAPAKESDVAEAELFAGRLREARSLQQLKDTAEQMAMDVLESPVSDHVQEKHDPVLAARREAMIREMDIRMVELRAGRLREAKSLQLLEDSAEQMVSDILKSPTSAKEANEGSANSPADPSQYENDEVPINIDTDILDPPADPREDAYVVVDDECDDDYTGGPVRLVVASDGIKDCAALLLTMDFSAKARNAILAQRDFERAERHASRQLEVSIHLGIKIKHEMTSHKNRINAFAEGRIISSAAEDGQLKKELEILDLMLQDLEAKRDSIKAFVQSQAENCRRIQGRVNAILEDAFFHAKLVEADENQPDTPIPEKNLQEEYQAFCERLAAYDDHDDADFSVAAETMTPLDTGRHHLEVPELSPEEQAAAKLRSLYWEAESRLDNARDEFNHREHNRAKAHQANCDAAARGEEPEDESPEAFDIRWVDIFRKLTAEVVEAEKAFEVAKAVVLAENVDIGSDGRSSVFVDQASDGYRMSLEQEFIDSVPSPRIKNWLGAIPALASPTFNKREGQGEGDEWEADDVEISDSLSMVAEGKGRRRIDKWRQICGV